MKYILLISILMMGVSGCGQKKKAIPVKQKEKPLYCNKDSIDKWPFEGITSGFGTYILHNGKNYQDTTNFPPVERLKYVGDTTIYIIDDTVLTAVYITMCTTCDVVKRGAYKVIHKPFRHGLYEDTLNNKRYANSSGYWWEGMGTTRYSYLTLDKKPFSRNTIIIREF